MNYTGKISVKNDEGIRDRHGHLPCRRTDAAALGHEPQPDVAVAFR